MGNPIGPVIRSIREQRGLTQADVCRRTGLQQSYLSRLEGADYDTVDVMALQKIADVLEITVDEILIRSHVRRVPDRRPTLRWKQLERLFRQLPEHRQEDILAIAKTLL